MGERGPAACDVALIGQGARGLEWARTCAWADVIIVYPEMTSLHEELALAAGAQEVVDYGRAANVIALRIERLVKARPRVSPGTSSTDELAVPRVRVGDLELDGADGAAWWRGVRVVLSASEFVVVQALVERPGYDVSVHALHRIAGCRGKNVSAAVRTLVKRVRRRFREVDPDFDCIEVYPGSGYRWRLTADS